jgi:hypothetical protein
MNSALPFATIEEVDCIAEGLLVKATVDDVESTLFGLGAHLEKDVYGRQLTGSGILVFQVRPLNWTTLLEARETVLFDSTASVPDCWDWKLYGQYLSVQLNTQVIWYGTRDSDGFHGYIYWEDGNLIECMAYSESEFYGKMSQDEILALQRRSDEVPGFYMPSPPYLFFSTDRPTLHKESIQDNYRLMENFLESHQACAFFRLYDLQAQDFERLDYTFWSEH